MTGDPLAIPTVKRVLPPIEPESNRSAGYVGYYAGNFLRPSKFDLVDMDGIWPAVWTYWKKSTRTLRVIEEKPYSQQMHQSQWRCYGVWSALIKLGVEERMLNERSGVYVVWDAERLVDPEPFPIRISRIGEHTYAESSKTFERRSEFDRWMQGE